MEGSSEMQLEDTIMDSEADQLDVSEPPLILNTDIEGPTLPREFIKIIPHPHSLDPTPIIVPLDSEPSPSLSKATNPVFQPRTEPWPWAPFQTLADFEYTETAIQGLLSKKLVDKQLAGINSAWAVESRLSIKNYINQELQRHGESSCKGPKAYCPGMCSVHIVFRVYNASQIVNQIY